VRSVENEEVVAESLLKVMKIEFYCVLRYSYDNVKFTGQELPKLPAMAATDLQAFLSLCPLRPHSQHAT